MKTPTPVPGPRVVTFKPNVKMTIIFTPDLHAWIATQADTELRSFNRQVVFLLNKLQRDNTPEVQNAK